MAGTTTLNPPPERPRPRAHRSALAPAAGALFACVLAASSLAANDPLLVVQDTTIVVRAAINPKTKEVCGGQGRLAFRVRGPAQLSIPGLPPQGATLDGAAIDGSGALPISPGLHVLGFSGSILTGPTAARTLEMRVKDASSAHTESQTLSIHGDIVNRSILPVGRTFLQGVDLMMGHVVTASTDLKVAGRHLSLDVGRTYAGSPGAFDGPTGARWTFTHQSRLTPIEECGLYVVTVGGGSSQTFGTSDNGRTFVPERGYHTSLTRLPDGSFEFVDKAANRFRFAGPGATGERTRRLVYFEEPHGDRLVYRYDARGRLIEVAESQAVAPTVRLIARTLRLRWSRAGGADRIQSISAPGLGLQVDYAYDEWGNLITATRYDTDVSGPAVEAMSYSSGLAADRHRLLSVKPASGPAMQYTYTASGQVQELVERPPKGGAISTTYKFERLASPGAAFRTTAKMSGLPQDVYDLNEDGREVRREVADDVGRVVENVVWAPDDILKVALTNSRGGETRYVHDERGNLIRETTTASRNAVPRVVVSEYHPGFNLLVRQVDADGGVSTWALDPRTGDLLESRDPKGVVEKYRYDSYGRVIEAETREGKSLFLAHDTFGSAIRVRLPSGKIETHEYDPRGRRYASEPEASEK